MMQLDTNSWIKHLNTL